MNKLLRFEKQIASCELRNLDEQGFVPPSKTGYRTSELRSERHAKR